MKRVLIITYYWPPSGGAGVQRMLKFVKYLRDFNIEPVVLTVDEKRASYPVTDYSLLKEIPSSIEVFKTPSFEPLSLLSAVAGKKNIPHGGFANQTKQSFTSKILRYIRGNFFIPDARVGWIRYAYPMALGLIKKHNIDTIIISSPPHSSQLLGLKLKKKTNVKWIADMRDPWTDIYYYKDLLHSESSKRKDAKYEMDTLNGADEIITVGDSLKKLFVSKLGESKSSKVHVIPNGYDETDFNKKTISIQYKFLITYTGTIAESYNPQIFFKITKQLIEKYKDINFELQFVGSNEDLIKRFASQNGLEKIVSAKSYLNHDEAIDCMLASTALLLVIPDIGNSETILTGKMFEYLAACKPVIGIGPSQGDAAKIIEECKAGKMFERNQEDQLLDYLVDLVEKWKKDPNLKLQGDIHQKYSRKNLTSQLVHLINKKSIND